MPDTDIERSFVFYKKVHTTPKNIQEKLVFHQKSLFKMEVIMAHIRINYHSTILQMPVVLDVLLPQGHGGYKVLYLLHGAGGDHASWLLKSRIADYVEGANLAIIMPSGNNKFYVNNIDGKDYFCLSQKN